MFKPEELVSICYTNAMRLKREKLQRKVMKEKQERLWKKCQNFKLELVRISNVKPYLKETEFEKLTREKSTILFHRRGFTSTEPIPKNPADWESKVPEDCRDFVAVPALWMDVNSTL